MAWCLLGLLHLRAPKKPLRSSLRFECPAAEGVGLEGGAVGGLKFQVSAWLLNPLWPSKGQVGTGYRFDTVDDRNPA